MAKFVESYTYEGMEGKPWSEVMARVKDFKAALMEAGAQEVTIMEGSLGADQGSITMMITFDSHAAWGAWADTMVNNPAWESKMEAWQKDPRVTYKRSASYSVVG
jgi:hypothetical protein